MGHSRGRKPAKVRSRDISIICQGAVMPDVTAKCMCMLRRVFPESEIILSTWKGSDIKGIPADKYIFSSDPGAEIVDAKAGTVNNVNRQIISTQAGLSEATRPYILKTRTDLLFADPGFLRYFGRYDTVPSPYFRNRLLICSYYTRNPRLFPLCFHPSDWLMFGRAEDVRRYYGALPLMDREDMVWFSVHPKESAFLSAYISRYVPEQHIFLNFLRQYEKIECGCYYDSSPGLIRQTEKALAECFVVLDYQKQLAVAFPKYNPNRNFERYTLVSHWQWRACYEHYCRKKFSPVWHMYIFRTAVLRPVKDIRKACVRVLVAVGMKETVKRWLDRKTAGGKTDGEGSGMRNE